jgi:hypothetical protein
MKSTQRSASQKSFWEKWLILTALIVFSTAQYAAADFTVTIEDPNEENQFNPLGSVTDPALSDPDDPLSNFTIDGGLSTPSNSDPFNLSSRPIEVSSDKQAPGEEVWNQVYESTVKTNNANVAALNGGNGANTLRYNSVLANMEEEDNTKTSFIMSKPAIIGIILGAGIALLGLRRVLRI